jgi:peptide/nickel transport system substrate-binding protein
MNTRTRSRRSVLRAAATVSAGATAWLVACGGKSESKSDAPAGSKVLATADTRITPTGAGTVTAQRGGTLRVAMSDDPTGLDPSTSRGGGDHHWLYSIFDNLVNNDPKFQPAPGIAESWEVVDDLTVAFKIQDGFTYQDGTPFAAEDIKYTIERHQDPATKSYAAGQVTSIDKVEVVDKNRVVIHLKEITASLFSILGDRPGMIFARGPVQKAGDDFTNHPIGSGPMKLDNWTVDASLKLSRFANFRKQGYPYLDALDFQIVPNSSVQFANLRSGNTDLIFVGQKDAEAAKNDPAIQYVKWPSTGYTQVNLNLSQPPLTDMRVRQAMTYALNRKAILEGIYFGEGEIANGPITRASWAFNDKLAPIAEDLKKAKDLLTAAGHPDGLSWDMVITPGEQDTPLAEMLKSQWARVGININLIPRNAEQAGAEYRDQKYPMFLVGFSGRADPDPTIYENFHSKGGFNRATFNKSYTPDDEQRELDAKIVKARQVYDQQKRKDLYDDIQRQIVENGHGIFFIHQTNRVGLSKRVRGFTPYGDGKLRLHELWIQS